MSDTHLIKVNKNIFSKIKDFFKNLFGFKNKKECKIQEIKEKSIVNNEANKTDFKDSIIIEEDKERIRLLKLQEEFRKGNITEEEMSEEDVEALHKLYDRQIAEIEESTQRYKDRIIEIRKKLNKI